MGTAGVHLLPSGLCEPNGTFLPAILGADALLYADPRPSPQTATYPPRGHSWPNCGMSSRHRCFFRCCVLAPFGPLCEPWYVFLHPLLFDTTVPVHGLSI